MKTLAARFKFAMRFSLATLLLFSVFCGTLMGVAVYHSQWVKGRTIKLGGRCSYLRFSGSKLLSIETCQSGNENARYAQVYDVASGQRTYSKKIDKYGAFLVGLIENSGNNVLIKSVPMIDYRYSKEQARQQGARDIEAPDDPKKTAYKWNNFDDVQFSWCFSEKKKNIALFEPHGIFYRPNC